jgi:hypothetical protein
MVLNSDTILEIFSNILLFVSSLLLLIDVAPRDFLPSHRRRVQAVKALRQNRNILSELPKGISIAPENSGMPVGRDHLSYSVLAEFIRQRSPLSRNVDWTRAVAVGYAVQSLPVGGATLEAFRPLYVVQIPVGQETRLTLIPVGQLDDLDAWLTQQHQSSLTRWALLLLVIGFFLQLVFPFLSKAC